MKVVIDTNVFLVMIPSKSLYHIGYVKLIEGRYAVGRYSVFSKSVPWNTENRTRNTENGKKMNYVANYKELEVYNHARRLSKEIFDLTKQLPKEERYSLIDQIRRSSRSVGAQIAEAWGKRRYEKHFISKLTDADAEQLETQHWLETAQDCNYISEETATTLIKEYEHLGARIGKMIARSSNFCK